MPFSTRGLRWLLAGGAIALLAVVLVFIGYAQSRARRLLTALPGRLGVEIKQETNGFTYSQSVRGQTVFTVHAAKEVQRRDGRIVLHDVGIELFGRDARTTDRIHGNEFEYDQTLGIMRAVGDVYIDLGAPIGNAPGAAGDKLPLMIHVKTSGLVFRQKERAASTDERIEFMAGAYTGEATGASYDSASGAIVLRSAVRLNGLRDERPVSLTAARAELDRTGSVVRLANARYASPTKHGEQTIAAGNTLIYLGEGNSPRSIKAEGAVTLRDEGGETITAERMDLELSAVGHPEKMYLAGGVRLTNPDNAGQEQHGQASEARLTFNSAGTPLYAAMQGDVLLEERADAMQRSLRAATLQLDLGGGGKQAIVVRSAKAFGGASGARGAQIQMIAPDPKGNGSSVTSIAASLLTANFGAASQVEGVNGLGETSVVRSFRDPRGELISQETSTGDLLKMTFAAGLKGPAALTQALQRGHVTLLRTEEPRPIAGKSKRSAQPVGTARIQHARGAELLYDAGTDRVTISGEVELSDSEGALAADHVQVDRESGDTMADGSVKLTYTQAGGRGEPMHVAAAHAVFNRESGITTFSASPGGRARMWQLGSQVEAGVLELDRTKRQLLARGPATGSSDAVRAVLAGSAPPAGPGNKRTTGTDLMHIASESMSYSDASRELRFKGHVRVTNQEGTMRAAESTVFLAPANASSAAGTDAFLGGRVERVVAQGAVEIQQPGRIATGDKLTYAAADQTFVLTGTRGAQPQLVDDERGTISGASLRFRSGDDSVVVAGDGGESGTARVRSEARLQQQKK